MSAKAKPSAVRAARDRAVQALKVEKAARMEYRRRTRRAEADPLQANYRKAHEMGVKYPDGRRSYFKLRNRIQDRLDKKYGTRQAHRAWGAACRDLRRAVKDLFRRPARSMDDLQMKARFWRSFSSADNDDPLDLKYIVEDAVHWFADGLIADLESGIG